MDSLYAAFKPRLCSRTFDCTLPLCLYQIERKTRANNLEPKQVRVLKEYDAIVDRIRSKHPEAADDVSLLKVLIRILKHSIRLFPRACVIEVDYLLYVQYLGRWIRFVVVLTNEDVATC